MDAFDPVEAAARFAAEAHAGQLRKGRGRIPYYVHLQAVVSTLMTHGYDDPATLAAAYLHDVFEDQPDWAARLRDTFPAEVVATVEVLSEKKADAQGQKRPKEERFQDFLAALSGDTPAILRARAISCADKLDNARSLLGAQLAGDQLLTRMATRPGQHGRHHSELRRLYAPVIRPSLLAAFDQAVAELDRYIAEWLLSWAVAIAADAHLGQVDRVGAPCVLHPLRMMLRARTRQERLVAVLHEVVEKSGWTLTELGDEGLSAGELRAIDCLTRHPETGESYPAYLERVLTDPLAMRVKLLDLEDDLELVSLAEPTQEDCERVACYQRAQQRIREALGEKG
jgi:(p)ppGpp synthase/HD superfamily hydrolase